MRTVYIDPIIKNNIWSVPPAMTVRLGRLMFACRNRQRMIIQSNRSQLIESTEARNSTVATESEIEGRIDVCGKPWLFA